MTASYVKYGLSILIGPILTVIVLTIWFMLSKKARDRFLDFVAYKIMSRVLPSKKRKNQKRNKKRR